MSRVKRYDDPQLADALAGEYVLGTLHRGARRRFEALLQRRPLLQEAVRQWEKRLAPLTEVAGETKPPPGLWTAIESRLGTPRLDAAAPIARWWRWLGVASTTLALALLVYIGSSDFAPPTPPAAPPLVAVLETAAHEPAWVISADRHTGVVRLASIRPQAIAINRSFELWALPRRGKPVSLGTVEAGPGGLARKRLVRAEMRSVQAFAISIEPRGGSPTGQPTGPIVYQGAALSL